MIVGIGVDTIEIARIAQVIERHGTRFLKKIFTQEEIDYCNSFAKAELHFAGRFAAKEAVAKALGTGMKEHVTFKDIGITRDAYGKPIVTLSKRVQALYDNPNIHISISHSKEDAVAFAVWER